MACGIFKSRRSVSCRKPGDAGGVHVLNLLRRDAVGRVLRVEEGLVVAKAERTALAQRDADGVGRQLCWRDPTHKVLGAIVEGNRCFGPFGGSEKE